MIECHHLRKVYPGDIVAVEDLSLHVAKGQIVCLIGTSGCGKTTTLKMINRLIEPTSGEVRIHGQAVREKDPIQLRRSIGYVIQRGGLMPHMTVNRNVALVAEVEGHLTRPEQTKRVHELLELVGLPAKDYAQRFPAELSGGEQQRVGIARALMNDPPVLLMDEPFGALDPITRKFLQGELISLNQKLHKTIVMVTHDLSEAFRLGDQIVLMSEGAIVQKGEREDFINRPVNEYVKEFVQSQMVGS